MFVLHVFHVFFTAKALKVKAKTPEGPTPVIQATTKNGATDLKVTNISNTSPV